MIITATFITSSGFATGLTPKVYIQQSDGTIVVNGSNMTDIGLGNYTYNFTTYDDNKLYFFNIDANSSSVINRYQSSNNDFGYYKNTQGFGSMRSGGTVRIDYRDVGKKIVEEMKGEGILSDDKFNAIYEGIESKINLLQDELNRKLATTDTNEQNKNRAIQEQIDGLYDKLDTLVGIVNKPKEDVKGKIIEYLDKKLATVTDTTMSKLANVEGVLGGLTQGLIDVKTKADGLSTKIDNAAKKEALDKLKKISDTIGAFKAKLGNVTEKITKKQIEDLLEDDDFKMLLGNNVEDLLEDDDFKELIKS